jgi:hypothetical protein
MRFIYDGAPGETGRAFVCAIKSVAISSAYSAEYLNSGIALS